MTSGRPPSFAYDLAAVFDQLRDSVGVYDRNGRSLYLNAAAAVRPDHSGILPAFERAARTGQPELFDHRDRALDRHFEVHIHAVGEVVFVLARDVTEAAIARRRLDALAELTALAQATHLHSFDDLAAVITRGLDADTCSIALLEADRSLQIHGFHDDDDDDDDDGADPAAGRADHPAFAGGAPEASALFADQLTMVAPLRAGGQLIGAVAASKRERPSARRYSETDLAVFDTFADRVALIVAHAAARAAAESAGRAKDEFLALLGHELRNPLAPIRTALDLMELRSPQSVIKERRVIERQVRHLGRMVDDLLDVARIAQGKIEIRARALSLHEVLATAVEMASPLIEARKHVLDLRLPDEPLLIEGDEDRLAQVFANLLRNAARYTDPGGHLLLHAEAVDGMAVIQVGDDGVGMSRELLPRVFELFVQGMRDSARSEGGLGLGLAIVRSLVTLHGGTVTAASDGPGHGSLFEVRLPLLGSAPPLLARVPPPPSLDPGPARILVVDDNRDAAEMLAAALDHAGFSVEVAHDGPSALTLAEWWRPTIALLDIGLPVMDGFELAGHLRRLPDGQDLRLIAVTGYGQDSDRKRVTAAGFAAHLVKPVSFDHLLSLLTATAGRTS